MRCKDILLKEPNEKIQETKNQKRTKRQEPRNKKASL
jgi:hypothetical protein